MRGNRGRMWSEANQSASTGLQARTGCRVVGRKTPGVVTGRPTSLLTRVDLPLPVEPPTTASNGASASRNRGRM